MVKPHILSPHMSIVSIFILRNEMTIDRKNFLSCHILTFSICHFNYCILYNNIDDFLEIDIHYEYY